MPFRLIISGSLIVGPLAGILAYNVAGLIGLYFLAGFIWGVAFILLFQLILSPTKRPLLIKFIRHKIPLLKRVEIISDKIKARFFTTSKT